MNKIYNNLSVDNLTKTDWFNQFDEMQKFEIETGIRSKVDVFKYAKKEFDGYSQGKWDLKNYIIWLRISENREFVSISFIIFSRKKSSSRTSF